MDHFKIMKLMSHLDEAIDLMQKLNFPEDADVLEIFSKKYRMIYQTTTRGFNGNS